MTIEACGHSATDEEYRFTTLPNAEGYFFEFELHGYSPGKGGYATYSLFQERTTIFGTVGRPAYCDFTDSVQVRAGERKTVTTQNFTVKGS
jgi:hypothetical protein